MKKVGTVLIFYGFFLAVGGMVGFVTTTDYAKAALFNGLFFGVMMSFMGILLRQNRQWAFPASLSASGLFTITFFWRMVHRMTHADWSGDAGAAIAILAVMGVISTAMFVFMFKNYRH